MGKHRKPSSSPDTHTHRHRHRHRDTDTHTHTHTHTHTQTPIPIPIPIPIHRHPYPYPHARTHTKTRGPERDNSPHELKVHPDVQHLGTCKISVIRPSQCPDTSEHLTGGPLHFELRKSFLYQRRPILLRWGKALRMPQISGHLYYTPANRDARSIRDLCWRASKTHLRWRPRQTWPS